MVGRRAAAVASSTKSWLVVLAIIAGLAVAAPASAEWLADLYLGASITQKGDVDLSLGGEQETVEDQEYKTSVLVGGRAGYWFGFFGVNLDFNYFRPEFDPDEASLVLADQLTGLPLVTADIQTDLRTLGIGFNAMLRGQFFKDSTVPAGRLQPYIFAGPTLFMSTLDTEGRVTVAGVGTETFDESDTSTKLGVTAGGGVTYMFTKWIGAFAEYRFTHVKPEFEIEVQGNTLKVEPTLNTHHLLAGVTFRF